MNNQFWVGNLTFDPELTVNPETQKVRTRISVALNEGERGTPNERSHFLDMTAFGGMAQNVVASLRKGTRVVAVTRVDTWQQKVHVPDRQTGQLKEVDITRTSYNVSAIGPDLRYATAVVTKNPRVEQPQGGQAQQQGGQAPQQPQQQVAPQGGYAAPQQVAPQQPAPQQVAPQGGYGQPAPAPASDNDF